MLNSNQLGSFWFTHVVYLKNFFRSLKEWLKWSYGLDHLSIDFLLKRNNRQYDVIYDFKMQI